MLVIALASCSNTQTNDNVITIQPSTQEETTSQEQPSTSAPTYDDTIVPTGEEYWAVSDTYAIKKLRKYGVVDSCTITMYKAKESTVEFPSTYVEKKPGDDTTEFTFPVIWIGNGTSGVIVNGAPTKIVIPSSVKTIKAMAFDFLLSLETLELNEGLETIENMAFWCCRKLKAVNLPSTLVSIGDNAFSSTGIETLVIPNSVVSIGKTAFASCTSLKSVTLPRRFESQVNDIFGTHAAEISFTFVD